jgi:hypothetical protein
VIPAIEFALLCAVAAFSAILALRLHVVRPHAVAALACAALHGARLDGGPRVAVAVFVLWPGVAVGLARALLAHHTIDLECAEIAGDGGGCVERKPKDRVRIVCDICLRAKIANEEIAQRLPVCLWFIRMVHTWPVLAIVAYAAALARWGAFLAPVWPWPLLTPNAAPAFALWLCRRPRTWAERAAYVLPASALTDVATTWSGAPGDARAIIGIVTWATFGGMIAACLTDRRARGRG